MGIVAAAVEANTAADADIDVVPVALDTADVETAAVVAASAGDCLLLPLPFAWQMP